MILKAVPSVNKVALNDFVDVFNLWSESCGINTPLRAAHFLAQVMHESVCLSRTSENLYYSRDQLLRVFPRYFNETNVDRYHRNPVAIANRIYANRMGNGSESSGDGWRYRGRGYMQLTGKSNYTKFSKSNIFGKTEVFVPELLKLSPHCTTSAMWFWSSNGCNKLADKDDIRAVTRRINGGLIGLSKRIKLLTDIKEQMGL